MATTKSGTRIHFTRACNIFPLIKELDAAGAPTGRLLDRAHIRVDSLKDPESLIPLDFAHEFVELAIRSEGIQDFAMQVARDTSSFELGSFGRQLQGALTVQEYLHAGIRLVGSSTSGNRFWLTCEGEEIRFNQYTPGKDGLGRCQADLYSLVITIEMLRGFSNGQWSPREVSLLQGDEKSIVDWTLLGSARILTGQPHTSFTIPLSLLQKPIIRQYDPLADALTSSSSKHMPEDFIDSIKQFIVTLLADGYPDIDLVAEMMSMSRRTLQRRLAESGFSYSDLVSQVRLENAARFLADTGMPVTQIAVSLGYTDSSNFTRAFRTRTGLSPSEYRENVSEQKQS
jgi:AraC-like DNA-binding protein